MKKLLVLAVMMAIGAVMASPAMAQTAGTAVDDQSIAGDTAVAAQNETNATSQQPVAASNSQAGLVPINAQTQVPVNLQAQIPVTLAANLQQVVASVAAELNVNVEV